MDLAHLANRASADPLDCPPNVVRRMSLVTHLSGDASLPSSPGELARFVDRMGERLLAINALARSHSCHRSHRMDVIRSSHQDGVDVLVRPLQHDAVVDMN